MPPEFWTPDLRFAPSGVTIGGCRESRFNVKGLYSRAVSGLTASGRKGCRYCRPGLRAGAGTGDPALPRRRGDTPGHVMKCHVLSCDVMFRRVAPLSVRLAEAPPSVSCIPFLHRVSVPFAPPPACLRRVPVSRVSHGRARAFAPARFARLIARACAREPGAGRTSPVRSVGVFSRRREAGDEAARGCRFLLTHLTTISQGSSLYRELFHNS